jgi:D-alanyl-lipoteichoic acid acyltransferase DltB (MBOAT superfamily)
MAIGVARLIGFNVSKNFDFPFFAQNIADFWRKWHISLTAWLTEYVFTPLSIAFRNYDKLGLIMAIVINFTICGIWHGANWTFALFGFLHGCYFIPLILKGTMNKRKKIAKGKLLPSFRELINVLLMFVLIMLTFVLFRADSVGEALDYYSNLFSLTLFSFPEFSAKWSTLAILPLIFFMITIEWFGREYEFAIEKIELKHKRFLRWTFYSVIIFIIGMYMQTTETPFIYFQF